MTTSVTVTAHCDNGTEVEVRTHTAASVESKFLADGETYTDHAVYGDKTIVVREVPKAERTEVVAESADGTDAADSHVDGADAGN